MIVSFGFDWAIKYYLSTTVKSLEFCNKLKSILDCESELLVPDDHWAVFLLKANMFSSDKVVLLYSYDFLLVLDMVMSL